MEIGHRLSSKRLDQITIFERIDQASTWSIPISWEAGCGRRPAPF